MAKENYLKDLMGHVMQIIYMVFLGILIAVFCGLGIDTFYPGPKMPDYPLSLQEKESKSATAPVYTAEELKVREDYDKSIRDYENARKPYARNVSMIAITLAVVALAISLTVLIRWEVIANGVLLGGVFTLGYSIIRGMESEDPKFRFFLVTIGVIIALVLGYVKFILPNKEKEVV
jgi:hypothetical protein